jgi:hypothetical protein
MNAAEALKLIQAAGRTGGFWIEGHARQRMAQRGARVADIQHGLSVARSCKLQDNGRWKVPTEDLDGDDLTLIVALDNGVVIVTLF